MESLSMGTILAGFVLMAVTQVIMTIRAMGTSTGTAAMALLVPGYVAFYATRAETRMHKCLALWALGVFMFLLGCVMLSVYA